MAPCDERGVRTPRQPAIRDQPARADRDGHRLLRCDRVRGLVRVLRLRNFVSALHRAGRLLSGPPEHREIFNGGADEAFKAGGAGGVCDVGDPRPRTSGLRLYVVRASDLGREQRWASGSSIRRERRGFCAVGGGSPAETGLASLFSDNNWRRLGTAGRGTLPSSNGGITTGSPP